MEGKEWQTPANKRVIGKVICAAGSKTRGTASLRLPPSFVTCLLLVSLPAAVSV